MISTCHTCTAYRIAWRASEFSRLRFFHAVNTHPRNSDLRRPCCAYCLLVPASAKYLSNEDLILSVLCGFEGDRGIMCAMSIFIDVGRQQNSLIPTRAIQPTSALFQSGIESILQSDIVDVYTSVYDGDFHSPLIDISGELTLLDRAFKLRHPVGSTCCTTSKISWKPYLTFIVLTSCFLGRLRSHPRASRDSLVDFFRTVTRAVDS